MIAVQKKIITNFAVFAQVTILMKAKVVKNAIFTSNCSTSPQSNGLFGFFFRMVLCLLGKLSNHDGDGSENGTKHKVK